MIRRPLTLTNDRPLEAQLGCFGYFGFGAGVAMALYGPANDTGSMYCNRCPQGQACWTRHRDRVRVLFPALVELAEEIAKTHKGPAYMQEFIRRTGQENAKLHEPFVGVMVGNMTDGAKVATGGTLAYRGTRGGTLTWPLEPLLPI